jgi:hypothetical protein
MYKKHAILGLFLLLVLISVLKPRVILNIYNNILGRVLLIGLVVFFTTCNLALGLLSALCLIIAYNMFFREGLTNLDDNSDQMIQPGLTIGDDTLTDSNDSNVKIIVTKDTDTYKAKDNEYESTISDLKAEIESDGVDRQSIQESIQAKSSKTIPVDKTNFESIEVKPNDPTTTSVIEGFVTPYGSHIHGSRIFKS